MSSNNIRKFTFTYRPIIAENVITKTFYHLLWKLADAVYNSERNKIVMSCALCFQSFYCFLLSPFHYPIPHSSIRNNFKLVLQTP